MDKEKYSLTLGGSVTVEGLTRNGNNYVSETEVDLSALTTPFSFVAKDSDGNVVESYDNAQLLQQVQYAWDGNKYYLAFAPVSDLAMEQNTQDSRIEYIAMMADIDLKGVQ